MTKAAENLLAKQIANRKIPEPVREYRVWDQRRWRFDFAWPNYKIAVEVHGGLFISGRHSRGMGQQGDFDKMNVAQLLGWNVFQFSTGDVKKGVAVECLENLFEFHSVKNNMIPPAVPDIYHRPRK